MSLFFPKRDTLQTSFNNPGVVAKPQNGATPYQARPELYGAFSVSDNAKDKAIKITNEAARDFEKASSKAQAKVGGIELYSGKFYAACTFGGMLACVGKPG